MVANTSIEEAKIGESLTQRSYEMLVHSGKGHSRNSADLIDKMEAHS